MVVRAEQFEVVVAIVLVVSIFVVDVERNAVVDRVLFRPTAVFTFLPAKIDQTPAHDAPTSRWEQTFRPRNDPRKEGGISSTNVVFAGPAHKIADTR
jgi:hypothetical protein